MSERHSTDWCGIGRGLRHCPHNSLWRTYCDALSRRWLARHLSGPQLGTILKTDAFDEAVGEGSAALLEEVADEVQVIDVSHSICGLASRRLRRGPVACDVRRLAFREESFDVVVTLSTLDHFEAVTEIEAALRGLHRVLRPGGRLLITLDNLSNPLVALRNSLPGGILEKIGLVAFPVGATLRPEQAREVLTRVGFTVEEMGTLMHVPRAPAVAVAFLLDQLGWPDPKRWFLRAMAAFEWLSRPPTSRWTGNYIAACCSKGSSAPRSKQRFESSRTGPRGSSPRR